MIFICHSNTGTLLQMNTFNWLRRKRNKPSKKKKKTTDNFLYWEKTCICPIWLQGKKKKWNHLLANALPYTYVSKPIKHRQLLLSSWEFGGTFRFNLVPQVENNVLAGWLLDSNCIYILALARIAPLTSKMTFLYP